jgi:hypothetical protein
MPLSRDWLTALRNQYDSLALLLSPTRERPGEGVEAYMS